MKTYSKLRSSVRPPNIEITANSVILASNITPYEEIIDGYTLSGFEYQGTEYTKDEYLLYQNEQIASLAQELEAAKILLGVE